MNAMLEGVTVTGRDGKATERGINELQVESSMMASMGYMDRQIDGQMDIWIDRDRDRDTNNYQIQVKRWMQHVHTFSTSLLSLCRCCKRYELVTSSDQEIDLWDLRSTKHSSNPFLLFGGEFPRTYSLIFIYIILYIYDLM